MKLHFESNLDYQLDAIAAVVDLFRGQEIFRSDFIVSRVAENKSGFGNRLSPGDDALLANLRAVQLRNGLALSDALESRDFTIEMETGTGKTYVYLRTIFELNRRYGFSKFAIVVPSVAIKEGVIKALDMTAAHFKQLFAGTPCQHFQYDSGNLGQVRNFASSSILQIMVVTVGAINKKDVNNLYKEGEKTSGERPIDLIKATRPILIVDEPQSVDGGLHGRGKLALAEMNPLCTLRYSATHALTHHPIYRLDAVDAYERKLVKQIEVAALEIKSEHERPYIKFISAANIHGKIRAKVELDCARKGGIIRKVISVELGDDLARVSGNAIYAGHTIDDIGCKIGSEYLDIGRLEKRLRLGESCGGADGDLLKRLMIRRTIAEHLDKELRLRPLGIKVLSLFFIDAVEHYRRYKFDGSVEKGKYAAMFETEYRDAATNPKYQMLFEGADGVNDASDVHNGYFSIDKNGTWTETDDGNARGRENAERAYNLIMREKEKLLSFETKLRFIFSHSALREGWDNPNVFQICALREIGGERERRQTLGRGLRRCVDQSGRRVRGFAINTLTVIAGESYERFAGELQKEIERDTGIQFDRVAKKLEIKNANARRADDAAKHGTEEREALQLFDFDNDALIAECVRGIAASAPMTFARVHVRSAELAFGRGGVSADETSSSATDACEFADGLPDVLSALQEQTQLTRRSLARVLCESGRLDDFARHPREFIFRVAEAINGAKRRVVFGMGR